MRTIAQKYREEGIQIGQKRGKLEGKLEGMQLGEEKGKLKGKEEIARSMLLKDYPIEDIMALTELCRYQIEKLI